MERIDVYRGGSTSIDVDGNTVQGPLELVASFQGLVAPTTETESPTVISLGAVTGYTIYIRGDEPTGILDTDTIGVRGGKYPVDGVVAPWEDKAGRHIGDQLAVRLKRG